MSDEPKNILETAIAEFGKPREASVLLHGDAMEQPTASVWAVSKDMAQVDMTETLDKLATKLQPWRRKGTARLQDLASFCAWANRHKGESSAIYANIGEKPSLTCIADYIGAGAPVMDAKTRDPKASYGGHRAVYHFPVSPEWTIWNGISGKLLSKEELGEFVEANAKDLFEPTPNLLGMTPGARDAEDWEVAMIEVARQVAGRFGQYTTLMQMARQFQINEVSNIATSLNRDTGESSIQFLDQHQQPDGSAMQVPNLFMILIPVFDRGASYRRPVRFRYRKAGSDVKFIFTLHNPEVYFDDAINLALKQVATETALPLFRGEPES